ncbi:MAG: hypothetical protein IJ217_03985 [Clostridia bacterium]|nr:hypothetical protein [Clostridia bacterium]
MGRIRDLEKLKDNKEYILKRAEVEALAKEYVWFTMDQDPLKTVETQLKTVMDGLSKEMPEEEEKKALREIHTLQVKRGKIRNHTYEPALKQNITAGLVQIEQYEASQEKKSVGQVIRGVLTNDAYIKNYLQRKYMIANVNRYGAVPNAVNLQLEDPREIIEYIANHYDLVGIKIDKEELSLVPTEAPRDLPIAEKVAELTNDFIEKQKDEKAADKPKMPGEKSQDISGENRKDTPKVRAPKTSAKEKTDGEEMERE